jgi:hypothetical protein
MYHVRVFVPSPLPDANGGDANRIRASAQPGNGTRAKYAVDEPVYMPGLLYVNPIMYVGSYTQVTYTKFRLRVGVGD